jgi:hypothetical protein
MSLPRPSAQMPCLDLVPKEIAQIIQRFGGLQTATALSQVNTRFWGSLQIAPRHKDLAPYFPSGLVCWVYVEDIWIPGIPLNTTEPYEAFEDLEPGIIFTCVRPNNDTVGQNVPYTMFSRWVSVHLTKPKTKPGFSMPRKLNLCTPYGILPNLLDDEGFYCGSSKRYMPPASYRIAKLPSALSDSVGSHVCVEDYIIDIRRTTPARYDVNGTMDRKIEKRLMKTCVVHRRPSNVASIMSIYETIQCMWMWEWKCGCHWMDVAV